MDDSHLRVCTYYRRVRNNPGNRDNGTMNQDLPSIDVIRYRFLHGMYPDEVMPTIHALLNEVDRLHEVEE